MANEESFHSPDEDRTSDLSANRKRKRQATVENGSRGNREDGVTRRSIALSNYWRKDHVCGTYFVRSITSGKRESLMKRSMCLIPSVESNMLRSFGHLVEHCATSSNNVGFNNVG